MKKQHFWTVTKWFFILILFLLLFFYRFRTVSVPVSKSIHSGSAYLLQAADDRLILSSSDGTKNEIHSIDPRTLPPYDQEALSKGIYIDNLDELEEILQDFR